MKSNKVVSALLGVAVGDALGVPFEFRSRKQMAQNPAKGMIGYGTYNQPPGTWSDDSSLTFCLAESLLEGLDLMDISSKFIAWRERSYWTARNDVFDIGRTTTLAITRLQTYVRSLNYEKLNTQKHEGSEYDNGNGSLMRILPLLFYIKGKNIKEKFEIVWDVSALTHRHIRAAMSCMIYLQLAEYVLNGKNKIEAYQQTQKDILNLWDAINFPEEEKNNFEKIIQNNILDTPIEELKTGGYVIEVLESSIWFFLKKENYSDTIISIVNLGHDTDTAAAITGGLAGIYYGSEGIPEYWIASLARMEDIIELGNKLDKTYNS